MRKGFDYTGIVVMNLCHNEAGEYLLSFRSDKCRDEHFTWEPLGSGGLKFGEPVLKAIEREVKEESGADVLGTEFIGYFEAFREIEGLPHALALHHP
jgi:ADP-ribose pyrophosphatase YjhB (NUDIX family)